MDNGSVAAPSGVPVYFVTSQSDGVKASTSMSVDPYQTAYGASLLALQSGNVDESLSILGDLGDVAIVEKLGSAITNKEFADVESMIQDAATDLTKRFLKGQKKGCAPKGDAFDLIDLLTLLQNDKDAYFYPRHPDFKYKRIGRASKVRDGYPEFKSDDGVKSPIFNLIGNSSELNLSIGLSIPGTVELPDEAAGLLREDIGLPKVFKSSIFRTYNIVSNAMPNVTKLPVSIGEETHGELKSNGVLPYDSVWAKDSVYVLDLSTVPACNRDRGAKALS